MTADQSPAQNADAQPGTAAETYPARQLALPATAQAPALARRATRETLASWQLTHVEEAAVLLVSELVTNVVLHAHIPASALMLRLESAGAFVRIEVHDADSCWPQPRTPDSLGESGFGLVLVDALADKWGVRETPAGKAVWAELDTSDAGSAQLGQ